MGHFQWLRMDLHWSWIPSRSDDQVSADAGGLVKRRLRQEPGAAGETLDRLITMLYTPRKTWSPYRILPLMRHCKKNHRDREREEQNKENKTKPDYIIKIH